MCNQPVSLGWRAVDFAVICDSLCAMALRKKIFDPKEG